MVGALRAGATDAPDFKAAADSVNANTTALAGAVGMLFTPAAGHSFEQLWADHIDLLVAYSAAIAKGDDAAKAQITQRAERVRGQAVGVPVHGDRQQAGRAAAGQGAARRTTRCSASRSTRSSPRIT